MYLLVDAAATRPEFLPLLTIWRRAIDGSGVRELTVRRKSRFPCGTGL